MQVVDVLHAVQRQDVRTHLRHVDALRRRLQQYVQGLAQQLHRTRDDHQADDQRGDRVRGLPAGGQDQRGRDEHRERAQGVRGHLQERAAHVQALLPASQQRERDHVRQQADRAERDGQPALGGGRRHEPLDGLRKDVAADTEQQQAVGAPPPRPGRRPAGRPAAGPDAPGVPWRCPDALHIQIRTRPMYRYIRNICCVRSCLFCGRNRGAWFGGRALIADDDLGKGRVRPCRPSR